MTEQDLDQAQAALGETTRGRLYDECQARGGCARWRFAKVYGSVARHLYCHHCLTRYDGRTVVDAPRATREI